MTPYLIRLLETGKARAQCTRPQAQLYVSGCILFSLGAKFFIDSHLGTDPLDVLVIGISHHLHSNMGTSASLVAIGFLAWWTVLNRKWPPLMPFVTTALVGYLIDLWNLLHIARYSSALLPPVWMLLCGLLLCGYASSLIIMSGIGIRIMDMVALTMIREWQWSFFRAKMTLEIGLFVSGWLLHGPLGIATFAFLFLVGPLIPPFMRFNSRAFAFPNYGLAGQSAREGSQATH